MSITIRTTTTKSLVLLIYWTIQVGTMAFNVNVNVRERLLPTLPSTNAIASGRRNFLSTVVVLSSLVTSRTPSSAFPFGENTKDRRQKELCLVNLLRLQYWARTTAMNLETSTVIDERKKAYLDARLGAKAMVAKKQKVGGGASARVFTLVSLQIIDCLDDLRYYSKYDKKVNMLKEDLLESLASIVEFDGLETTQDPSPRSSLTLGQFNEDKATFIRRMLNERVVPLTEELIDYFGPDPKVLSEGYVKQYYSNELPPSLPKLPTTESSITTSSSETTVEE